VPSLRLTPYAWAKLLYLRDLGSTEVGGFGISATGNLLLIEDLVLVRQTCTDVSVKFDDAAVADHFDKQVDLGRPPEQFARIWIHTHPGNSPAPSGTDEETFARCFGGSDWAVMFILARGGRTYARLRFRAGPGGQLILPVELDFSRAFPAAAPDSWELEYTQCVTCEQFSILKEPAPERRRIDRQIAGGGSLTELDCTGQERLDPPRPVSLFWPSELADERFDHFLY